MGRNFHNALAVFDEAFKQKGYSLGGGVAGYDIRLGKLICAFGEGLRHTACKNYHSVWQFSSEAAHRLTGFAVAFGGYGAGIYNIYIGILSQFSRNKAPLYEELRVL